MPLSPETLDRTLKLAQDTLSVYEKKLADKQVAAEKYRKDPIWRKLNAAVKKIKDRISAQADVHTRGEKTPEASEESE